jgi:hypothetical protein
MAMAVPICALPVLSANSKLEISRFPARTIAMKRLTALLTLTLLAGSATFAQDEPKATGPKIIGAAQAHAYVGSTVVVTGLVAQVSLRPGLVFLNFEKPFPDSPFSAVVRGASTNEFDNLPGLKGKAVEIKGEIKEFKGKPEILLIGKHQLKIVETPKKAE